MRWAGYISRIGTVIIMYLTIILVENLEILRPHLGSRSRVEKLIFQKYETTDKNLVVDCLALTFSRRSMIKDAKWF